MFQKAIQLLDFNFWLYLTLTLASAFVYRHVTNLFNYWPRRGVAGPRPLPIIGTLYQWFSCPVFEVTRRNVKQYGKIYGSFFLSKPQLNIADPELAKQILVKDFNNFVNHQQFDWQDPMLDRMLFSVEDDDWRHQHRIVAPAFANSKMRKMHYLVERCVDDLEAFVRKAAETKTEVQLKKLAGKLTMQVVALCAFATRIDTYNDPNNQFIVNALKFFSTKMGLRFILVKFLTSLPLVNRLFKKIPAVDPRITGFFKNITKEIIDKRNQQENNQNEYHDLLQLLVNAKKKSENENVFNLENDKKENSNNNVFGDIEIYANAFIFFLAGFETTHNVLAFLLHSLVMNPDVHEKLYQEVKKHVDENGTVDYDTIQQMSYLDACVSETLRMYNPIIEVYRIAGEDYHLPGTDIVIKKGAQINVQIHAIHHDSDYYLNPYQFDPTRFLPENKDKLVPFTFMPFSDGPRNCVGSRFAVMVIKTAVVRLVNQFRFVPTVNTANRIEFKKFIAMLLACGELPAGVELR